jgi:hypothetical protein
MAEDRPVLSRLQNAWMHEGGCRRPSYCNYLTNGTVF